MEQRHWASLKDGSILLLRESLAASAPRACTAPQSRLIVLNGMAAASSGSCPTADLRRSEANDDRIAECSGRSASPGASNASHGLVLPSDSPLAGAGVPDTAASRRPG